MRTNQRPSSAGDVAEQRGKAAGCRPFVRGAHGADRDAVSEGGLPIGGAARGVHDPEDRDEVRSLFGQGVAANNTILKKFAGRSAVSFVETDHLVSPTYLIDDCHFNTLGESELARTLAEHLSTELPEPLPTRRAG